MKTHMVWDLGDGSESSGEMVPILRAAAVSAPTWSDVPRGVTLHATGDSSEFGVVYTDLLMGRQCLGRIWEQDGGWAARRGDAEPESHETQPGAIVALCEAARIFVVRVDGEEGGR